MNFVNEQDGLLGVSQFLEHGLQTLLEVTAVFGAGQQRAHIQGIDMRIPEDLRHFIFRNAAGQALGDSGLAHAGFADQQRVVLAAAAQGLDHALQLQVAADQRIDLAGQCLGIKVQRVVVQGAALACGFGIRFGFRRGLLFADLRGLVDAVGDVVHHVQARDIALVEEVHRVRFLFAKQRDQDVGAVDLLFVGRLHVQDGALDNALEADGWLGIGFSAAGQDWRVAVDEVGQRGAQFIDIRAAGTQHLSRRRVVEHGQ